MTAILTKSGALRDLQGPAQTNANKSFVSRRVSVYFGCAAYFTGKLFQKDVRDFNKWFVPFLIDFSMGRQAGSYQASKFYK